MYPPPKKKIQNKHQAKGTTPDNHQSIIKNICVYFQKKPNGSQEIEKNTTRQTKKCHKKVSRRGLAAKTFFSAVSTEVMLKTSLQTFMKRFKDLTV